VKSYGAQREQKQYKTPGLYFSGLIFSVFLFLEKLDDGENASTVSGTK